MKIKTSLSLEEAVLERAKALAKAEDRSTSNFLERVINSFVNSLPANDDESKNFLAPANVIEMAGAEPRW